MATPKWNTASKRVYQTLCSRLMRLYSIDITEYIAKVTEAGIRLGQGFKFVPKDHKKLQSRLTYPQFAQDDTRYFCDQLAAMVTQGKGYREIGVPSLHFAIAPDFCSVHLDASGFVAIGPDGKKYYNADAILHIVDDLGMGWLVEQLDKSDSKVARYIGELVSRVHPIVPNLKDLGNDPTPKVGGKVNLRVTHDPKTGEQNSAFDFSATHSTSGETQLMFNYEVRRDWDQDLVNLVKRIRK
jgi:hypothetical protein